jgi:Mg/Co/Ni transporter MgtE
VAEAIEVLRELPDDFPSVHYIYVTDEMGSLSGILSLRTLAVSKAGTPIKSIMHDDVITVKPEVTEEEVSADIFKYDVPAIPVVDENGAMLGVITTEDAWDAIEDEVTGEKTQTSALRVVGLCVAALLFLALYTLVLISVFNVTGLPQV